MKYFLNSQWKALFLKQGLADFQALWELDLISVDKPNRGRGHDGWSSVCAMNIDLDNGLSKKLIIKRQQNHNSRTLFHPFTGIPTFEKEIINILHYDRQNIPVLKPVYFAKRKKNGLQAILITEFLDGFVSLDNLAKSWENEKCPRNTKNALIKVTAKCISRMHSKGLMHNSLYPKHIFIKRNGDDFLISLIDLEKNKQGFFALNRMSRDLGSLHRHSEGWSTTDRIRFLYTYFNTNRLDQRAKNLCKQIIKKHGEKDAKT